MMTTILATITSKSIKILAGKSSISNWNGTEFGSSANVIGSSAFQKPYAQWDWEQTGPIQTHLFLHIDV